MQNSSQMQKLGYLISENKVFDIIQKTTLIGRSPSCHIVIKVAKRNNGLVISIQVFQKNIAQLSLVMIILWS